MTYAALIIVIWKAYLGRIYNIIKHPKHFYRYHIIDTGETGECVFKDGENRINGTARIFDRKALNNGSIFYEENNAEPIKIVKSIKEYKYYCDTKNFDTVTRNDILETLMILRAKELIQLLLIVIIVMVLISMGVNYYLIHTAALDIQNQINTAIETAKTAAGLTQV